MCGIGGWWHVEEWLANPALCLERASHLLAHLRHRGPDGTGIWLSHNCCLVHARLAVIDPAVRSAQPFTTEKFAITYNGEIFNYKELGAILERKGIPLRTRSDTEVLLWWFATRKEEGLSQLRGFFAFAFYDIREDRLWLVRDPLGVKPLYWTRLPRGGIAFASELRALTHTLKEHKHQLNVPALLEYLQMSFTASPTTLLHNIYRLDPGTFLHAHPHHGINTYRYFELNPTQEQALSHQEAIDTAQYLLARSVERRLVSDVPVGIFLSGGIDSSLVTALAAHQRTPHLKCAFHVSFTHHHSHDETHRAKLVARYVGIPLQLIDLEERDIKWLASAFVWKMDEPLGDPTLLPLFVMSWVARQQVKVVLTGDGGDEPAGGYRRYLAFSPMTRWLPPALSRLLHIFSPLLPPAPAKWLKAVSLPPASRYWLVASHLPPQIVQKLTNATPDHLQEWNQKMGERTQPLQHTHNPQHTLNQVLLIDTHTILADHMFLKLDRASMSWGLEAREPLADIDLVQFLLALPAHYKVHGTTTKWLLRKVAQNLLPASIANAPKKGFDLPVEWWLTRYLTHWAESCLLTLRTSSLFNRHEIEMLRHTLLRGRLYPLQATTIWHLSVLTQGLQNMGITLP